MINDPMNKRERERERGKISKVKRLSERGREAGEAGLSSFVLQTSEGINAWGSEP